MAAKFIPKVKRKSNNNQPKDEFYVHDKQIMSVKKFREKIEQMYQVQIRYEKKAEDGQWLILEGEPVDRRNAKNYISALCHPSEVKQVQFPTVSWSQVTDPEALEDIEKKTNAVIRPLSEVAKFEISGTELAVTLAMSLMEELIGSIEGSNEDTTEDQGLDKQYITISPATRQASVRLSDVLQRALSEHSDGICSVQDYSHATESVKRVLVNCLQDTEEFDNIDDDLLFADGDVKKPDLTLRCCDDEEDDSEIDEHSPRVSDLTEQLTEAAISKPNDSSSAVSKNVEDLRNFGISVGYPEDSVKKALDFVDEKTRYSDFMDILKSIEDSQTSEKAGNIDDIEEMVSDDDEVVILETETIEVDEEGKESKRTVERGTRKDSVKSNLPEGYIEKLLSEDDNCSVQELKRRNAERQQLLKQNFQAQKSSGEVDKQNQGTGKQKGKSKKKQKKAQAQKAKQETHYTPHNKQFKLDSCENTNYSQDEDQTCVLRVCNGAQASESQHPMGNGIKKVLLPTPKMKPADFTHALPKGQSPRQNDQNQWQQAGRSNPRLEGSPNRGQAWNRKPTQIVTPVNLPVTQLPPAMPPVVNGNELRYIVIDGSNVAMTHGNGKCFSCKGLRICVDYFKKRGHNKITVFVPQWRQYQPSADNLILDQNILYELKEEEILVFTPCRRIGRKLVAAYDDRFVLELAEAEDGIIVSNDQYRDLMYEKANWRKLIEERLLMFSFVGDRFMPPSDPLGRDGPTIDVFLRKIKHPTQQQRPLTWQTHHQVDQRQGYHRNKAQTPYQQGAHAGNQTFNKQVPNWPQPQQQFQQVDYSQNTVQQKGSFGPHRGQGQFPVKGQGQLFNARTEEQTESLYRDLRIIFPDPDQDECVRKVLANHLAETDITKLTNYCMSVLF